MTSYSPVRYLHLVQHRPRFLLITVGVSTVIAAIIGLVSPYLYSSTAVIQYQPKPQTGVVMHDDGAAFHKVTMLVSSSQVLGEVAKTLANEPLDPYYYFPKTIPILDIKTRAKLLLRHLGLQKPDPTRVSLTRLPINVIVSLLDRHLKVRPDNTVMTLNVSYEAGDPEIAQHICDLVSQAFIALSLEMEKNELKHQEKYIEDAIARQSEMIHSAENDLRSIVEEHPSMAASEDKGSGMTPAAQRYVKKQERLEKIDEEFGGNQKLLASIETELGGSSSFQNEISGNVAAKVTEELSELEFRRINSVKFGGYTEDHPSIYKLDKRIQELKEVLANLGENRGETRGTASKKHGQQGDIRALFAQATSLREKNRALKAEKEVLLRSLTEEDSRFRKAVKVNFEYDSIGRNLQSSQGIMNELYRDLQKIRLVLSGISASAIIVDPANFSPHSTNLSIQKRVFFAAFVNLAFIFSLLILYEIFRPTLLVPDDLRSLKLAHLGQFKHSPRGFAELSSCLLSLGEPRLSTGTEKTRKRVLSLMNFAPTIRLDLFSKALAEAAKRDNLRVALVLLDDPDHPTEIQSDAVTVQRVSRQDALLSLRDTVSALRAGHEFILIAETGQVTEPVEALLAQLSEHFVYITEFGKTVLAPIATVRHLPELSRTVRHHSAVVEPIEGLNQKKPFWQGPHWPRNKAKATGRAA